MTMPSAIKRTLDAGPIVVVDRLAMCSNALADAWGICV